MEDYKGNSTLLWGGEQEEDDDDNEEEWQNWPTNQSKRHNTGAAKETSSIHASPARKKLRMDLFCSPPEERSADMFSDQHNHNRTIVHIDIDCFYAQVEIVLNPSLQNKPLGIRQKHTVVTCNYIARARGLTKMMRISDAKKKCPDLVLVNGENLSKYREFSKRVNKLVLGVCPSVERLGFDENFIDVTSLVEAQLKENPLGTRMQPVGMIYGGIDTTQAIEKCSFGCHERLAIGSHIAFQIRQEIFSQIGLTCSAGIAHNKLLAKLSGECHKPNNQTTLFPEFVDKLMRSLPARKIPGIGSSMAKRLQSIGIISVLELQSCSSETLTAELGDGTMALMLKKWSYGYDVTEVIPSGDPKSMSEEDSYCNCSSLNDITKKLQTLNDNLIQRLTDDIGVPQTIRLTIRRGIREIAGDKKESRQCPTPIKFPSSWRNDQKGAQDILLSATLDLFKKLVNIKQPFMIKLLSVCLTNFQKPSRSGLKAFSGFITNTQSTTMSADSVSNEELSEITFQNAEGPNGMEVRTHVKNQSERQYQQESISLQNKISQPEEEMASAIHSSTKTHKNSQTWTLFENQKEVQTYEGNISSKEMPLDVDPEVFNCLPVEIQQELMKQWKQERTCNNKNYEQMKKVQQPKGLLRYFSKS